MQQRSSLCGRLRQIISLNNRFLNIYEQCIIKMSFLSCNYEIKCIFNIFNLIFHMSTCAGSVSGMKSVVCVDVLLR